MTSTLGLSGVKYAVDLVMCIDATGSMGHLIEEVKSTAMTFYEKLEDKIKEKQKTIDQLRAKVIVFSDYYCDPEEMTMISSEFFNLRTEAPEFAQFVSLIGAGGGGDEPENGLEALALAINSDWEKTLDFQKQRHIVLVWTDASCHPLEKSPKPSFYPDDMPNTLDELADMWDDMSNNSKRLLLFTPDSYPWIQIASSWDNTIQLPSEAGQGMEEYEMAEILDAIANSI